MSSSSGSSRTCSLLGREMDGDGWTLHPLRKSGLLKANLSYVMHFHLYVSHNYSQMKRFGVWRALLTVSCWGGLLV